MKARIIQALVTKSLLFKKEYVHTCIHIYVCACAYLQIYLFTHCYSRYILKALKPQLIFLGSGLYAKIYMVLEIFIF
jgi:hypothetical protein